MRKHGIDNFSIEEIDRANSELELNAKEIDWINRLNSTDPSIGYNCKSGGDGGVFSESARSRLKQRPPPTEAQRKLASELFKGKPISAERHAKMMAAWRGSKHTPETIAKMSESHKRSWTPERRSAASLKRKQMWSQGIIVGHFHSESSKEKMRSRVVSDETRAKLSIAARLRKRKFDA